MNIFALSTGPGISGIAVIRISGEETSKIINAGNLRCEYDEFGKCKSVNICSGSSMLTPYEDDCLFEEQERAWSSPIWVSSN